MNNGRSSNLRSGNPNMGRQGGSPRTMVVAMATVAAGFGGWWMLQFRQQNRSHNSSDPAEMPTWQHRHAQQAPQTNESMSMPGHGAATSVRNANQQHTQYTTSTTADTQDQSRDATCGGSGGQSQGRELSGNRGAVGSVMSAIHGSSKDSEGAKSQPVATSRTNDRGGMYTKSSDFKDSYRRE
ncbi:uncharacterized protein BXZ73DRAFT_74946 [Epithele typhae]|uniref:uncharacterized protein n=1 Tax=Epithele typhae TaxID=378194 RepID=UPI0020075AE9|nr:uncharacterized protein BXZ73DRAFT_74946 [Epithele typhae]KAH9941765.1 hypothetical protein BXZ73DRAFT_74946 [Epithele typhae]